MCLGIPVNAGLADVGAAVCFQVNRQVSHKHPHSKQGGRLLRRPYQRNSGQEILVVDGFEFGGGVGAATQRLAVPDLLDVAQPAGNTLVAVGVERVEAQGNVGVHAGVHFAAVKNRAHMLVYDLGRGPAVGVDEVAACVGVVVALGIAVAQRQLQRALRRNLAAKFADTVLDGAVDGGVDGVDCFHIGLGDDDRAAELGIAAVDGLGLPDVGVGKADEAGDDFGVVLLCHNTLSSYIGHHRLQRRWLHLLIASDQLR